MGKVIHCPDAARKRSESRYLYPGCIFSRSRGERTVFAERINRAHSLIVICPHAIESNVERVQQAWAENMGLCQSEGLTHEIPLQGNIQPIRERVGCVVEDVSAGKFVLRCNRMIHSSREKILIGNLLRAKRVGSEITAGR